MSTLSYRRRATREVRVGDVGVGGDNPIRVQSMTTPKTTDTAASVEQIVRLVDAGCEIVRLTVPSTRDAENLPNIREELRRRGIRVPLVADIHFTPAAALKAAPHVDKVRINPGNFADTKKFAVLEYTDADYAAELARIEAAFAPLVARCKELGIAMRIGTNHGSLSDRIMNRYGDTPEGMVESALEFVRICEVHAYHDIILSMKASNPVVVLQAYRHLVERMDAEKMAYPLHLGVTEAGGGEDARIKSAIGIGTLLEEGIGDTVRVSLTEDPVQEIPVARALVSRFNGADRSRPPEPDAPVPRLTTLEPVRYSRRECDEVRIGPLAAGGRNRVLVEVPLPSPLSEPDAVRRELEAAFGNDEDAAAEIVCVDLGPEFAIGAVRDLRREVDSSCPAAAISVRVPRDTVSAAGPESIRDLAGACHRVHLALRRRDGDPDAVLAPWIDACRDAGAALLLEAEPDGGDPASTVEFATMAACAARDAGYENLMLGLGPGTGFSPLHSTRELCARLAEEGSTVPVVLVDRPLDRGADPLLAPSSALGGLLCEGIGDAVHVRLEDPARSRELAYGILQASRVRITRTEFISCPSCGRTLFDLETTTERIKERTSHLKGVKIAIMGCVVNGPGEMADADFGYVGWGKGKIALFVGKEMVEKDIPAEEADGRLVDLIRRHGRWVDPPAVRS